MSVAPELLTRALNGNTLLDTIEKTANALGVSVKSLFEDNSQFWLNDLLSKWKK